MFQISLVMDKFSVFDARFKHPFSMVISGPSQCGKSTFVFNLLKHAARLIDVEFDYIVCFSGSDDVKLQQLRDIYGKKIIFVSGLPDDLNEYIDSRLNGFLVFDDLMQETTSRNSVTELFTRRCHHENFSIALILQNLFYSGKGRQTMLRSSHYLVIFRNPLDQTIIYTLAHRINPLNKAGVIKIFFYAQSKYRYLLLDGKQDTVPEAQFRTDIFNTSFQRCFVLK